MTEAEFESDASGSLRPVAARIVRALMDAVLDRALPPGIKLGEESIARQFDTSRATVRVALQHLAQLGIVTIEPNRGAFLTRPNARLAADLYSARRTIESQIVVDAARHCTAADMREMLAHIGAQDAAANARDGRELVRLRGDFHLLIARVGANAVLYDMLARTLPRCALVRAQSEHDPFSDRPVEEHRRLASLIAKGQADKAVALMRAHLTINERQLRFPEPAEESADIIALIAPYARAPQDKKRRGAA
jgi:DNA-binding GntR family transcriptional regulator